MRLLSLLLILGSCADAAIVQVTPPDEATRGPQTDRWLAEVLRIAQDGDWLVVRGYHPTDDLVVAATNIPLSHAAVLDKQHGRIIEAVGEGVRFQELRAFVHGTHRLLIIRPKWWSPKRGARAVRLSQELVGRSYDFLGAVGDPQPESFYCSELAMHVYRKYFNGPEHMPRVIEPGQMYLWGSILWDSGWRDDQP